MYNRHICKEKNYKICRRNGKIFVTLEKQTFHQKYDPIKAKKKLLMWTSFVLQKVRSVSCSVVFNSLQTHGLQPARLLCPWDFPGRNTGVSCHSPLQGIFPTQGSNPGLLHFRHILYPQPLEDTIKRMKKLKQDKVFTNLISDKGLIFRICLKRKKKT